jgi:hypothetical protein
MGISDIANRYSAAIKRVIENQDRLGLGYGENHIALVNNRLEKDGTGFDGIKFPKYSDNPLPLFFFYGKSNRSSAYESFTKKVTKGKVVSSYSEWRKHNGLPTDRRTFVFTGDMLASIRSEVSATPEGMVTITIQSPDSFNRNKVEWNQNKVGKPILKATDDEREKLMKAYTIDIRNLIFNQ